MKAATWVKSGILRGLRRYGWEIKRYSPNEEARLVHFLKLNNIETVLDVGANTGQFGTLLRKAGYTGQIISFEPQSAAHAALTRRAPMKKSRPATSPVVSRMGFNTSSVAPG